MIHIGSDHAGYKLKEEIKKYLTEKNYEFEDLTPKFNEKDDYPDAAQKVAEQVLNKKSKGILICGTGIGMSIAANKVPGIRAALCSSKKAAELAKKHNNSNILVLSGWLDKADNVEEIIETWLKTEYERQRHEKRLEKIRVIEQKFSKNI
ncbi:MAG: ribose 5-phosphate isomerase B [Nanoarchaeota archaeon]|nr:ribose 5-phosphate isomerase B [Nanoarchaeota archaeon]MBU1029596.1 ribose 5-phosphate isomerase B [Nanoarchaeota archaeon]MBU1850207.1 ribose 5-phosphate isomerase B [Nanoarchaeota archaeon]